MLKLFLNNTINQEVPIKQWKFPAGEIGIKIEEVYLYPSFNISLVYESSDDLIGLLLLVDALRNINKDVKIILNIPYFPYARQDRVCANGESFSLRVIANLIKSCNFDSVKVQDAHSDVLGAFFGVGVLENVEQCDILSKYLRHKENFALVSPDAGALKKIYTLAKILKSPVIEASKVRSVSDGKIIETRINDSDLSEYEELIIVDDICDGGRTFVELAKVIRKTFSKKLTLVVTHGIFSNGFSELDKYFDEILFENDLRKDK